VGDDSDATLLERYRSGDASAFRELVLRYQRPVYNAAYWILHNADDANDVAQTVFLRVAEHAGDYDPNYKVFSWLYRIAVNEALNVHRRLDREEPLADGVEFEADGDEPLQRLEAAERARLLRGALTEMSMTDRTVLTLRHFAELSYRDIGEVLELDEKTVKSRLFEARQRLKALLPGMH
jgi:RNA polymerase sigma-70 factor (ECF subfamily)